MSLRLEWTSQFRLEKSRRDFGYLDVCITDCENSTQFYSDEINISTNAKECIIYPVFCIFIEFFIT